MTKVSNVKITITPAKTKTVKYHTVKADETLSSIAKKYYGNAALWNIILKANPGIKPEALKVGSRIIIPPLPKNLKKAKPVPMLSYGEASWYGPGFQGEPTACGEIYDQNKLTVAHLTLPFGTVVKITNLKNNKSILARVNDRGPYVEGRIVDLSKAAAEAIGMNPGVKIVKGKTITYGMARVRLEVVKLG